MSADGAEPDLWFVLPTGFSVIGIEEDPETRMLRMADAIAPMFPGATPDQKLALVMSSEYALGTLLKTGAVHVSSCLYRRDDSELSQGMLAVFIKTLGAQDRLGLARSISDQWALQNSEAEVGGVYLPYGPAALSIQEREVPVPGSMYGVKGDTLTTVRQLQAAVPLQCGTRTAIFTFTTEDIADWGQYVQIVAQILESVAGEEPELAGDRDDGVGLSATENAGLSYADTEQRGAGDV